MTTVASGNPHYVAPKPEVALVTSPRGPEAAAPRTTPAEEPTVGWSPTAWRRGRR